MYVAGIFKVVNQLQHAWVVSADFEHLYLVEVKVQLVALHLLLVDNFDGDLLVRRLGGMPRVDLPEEPLAKQPPLHVVLVYVPISSPSGEPLHPGVLLLVRAHVEHSLEGLTQLHLDLPVVDALDLDYDGLIALNVAGDEGMHEFYFLLGLINVACQVLTL